MVGVHTRVSIRIAVAVSLTAIASVPAEAAPRPIGDFLEAQGTYCVDFDGLPGCDLFFPPEPNLIHWSGPAPEYNLAAIVDYAGLFDNYLVTHGENSVGTTVEGHVNERSLSNGRAEVHVTLQTKNALTYVLEFTETAPDGALVYGQPLADVLAGAEPALSTCSVNMTFTNTAPGAPLPDLLQVAFYPSDDQFLQSIGISCSGRGALAGGGAATFIMRENGTLLRTPFKGANGDGFPVELIALKPLPGNSALQFREAPEQ